jgi:glutamate--cysteine ligase
MTNEAHVPIARETDLDGYFAAGARPRQRWGVGLEYERFGVLTDTLAPAPYEGERSIEALLRRLVRDHGWDPSEEDGRLLGARKGETRITLEPGCQVELSGGVHRRLEAMHRELLAYVEEIEAASAPLGIAFLGVGMQPLARLDRIPWIPKKRYAIMREYLPTRGGRAHVMMKQTACIQANIDYDGERDAADKMRSAMGLTPLVTALFANSPLTEGSPNGFMSARAWAWRDTDPDRCGLLPFVFREDAGFGDYLDYALDVPMFFIVRQGTYVPAGGLSFRRFIRDGLGGERPTLADFELHLTTLFPEVRLKRYIELRGADSGDPSACLALAALWKGLLYDDRTRGEAFALVRDLSLEDRNRLLDSVCRQGPEAAMPVPRSGGAGTRAVRVRDVLDVLLGLARQGLQRQGAAAEAIWIDLLERRLADQGGCPARRLLDDWEGVLGRDPARLVAALGRSTLPAPA